MHYSGGTRHRLTLGSARANHRHFVAADGTKRAHCVGTVKRRCITPETLPEQLPVPGYVGVRPPFEASSRDPR